MSTGNIRQQIFSAAAQQSSISTREESACVLPASQDHISSRSGAIARSHVGSPFPATEFQNCFYRGRRPDSPNLSGKSGSSDVRPPGQSSSTICLGLIRVRPTIGQHPHAIRHPVRELPRDGIRQHLRPRPYMDGLRGRWRLLQPRQPPAERSVMVCWYRARAERPLRCAPPSSPAAAARYRRQPQPGYQIS
jgi:hypothetical protein